MLMCSCSRYIRPEEILHVGPEEGTKSPPATCFGTRSWAMEHNLTLPQQRLRNHRSAGLTPIQREGSKKEEWAVEGKAFGSNSNENQDGGAQTKCRVSKSSQLEGKLKKGIK